MSNVVITEKISSSGSYASLDAKYGPYASVAAANTALGQSGADCIAAGLTVGILENGAVVEYWYQNVNGSLQLVEKQTAAGVTDYADLENKPQINSVALSGNKSSSDLGLQNQLVSGTTIKTINGQSVLGSGNLNTANGYIYADDMDNAPTASADYASKILLIPSTSEVGGMNQYACILDAVIHGVGIQGWSWVLAGTTSPIVSVQETDTLQQLLKWKTLPSYRPTLGTSGNEGNISAATGTNPLSSSIYYIGDADEVYANFRVLPNSSTHGLTIWYYDETLPTCALGSEHAAYLGSAYDRVNNPDSTAAIYTNQRLEIPDGTKYILIVYTANLYEGNEYDSCKIRVNVSQYVVKKQVTPNVINYFETYVTSPVYNNVSSSSEETTTQNLSAWGIVFPSSYSNVGIPTQIIAMLHGLSGYVTSEVLGYGSTDSWVAWRNKYLDAGFAVLDINGYGVSSSGSDFNSRHYGNPQFVETLDKAFEYLKTNYNVCDKLLLHGTSMGGGGAMSYLMTHPNKVNGVGLFAPTLLPYSLRKAEDNSSALVAWGYNTALNASNDGYKRLVGYAPMMENSFDWTTVEPSNTTNPIASFTSPTKLPNVPIRIWQGTNDETVPYNNTSKLVELLRKGNTQVILRTCLNGTHSVSTGTPEYVQNEAVSWFKRFVI